VTRIAALGSTIVVATLAQAPISTDFEALPFGPRRAVCYRADAPPVIDGVLGEAAWRAAPWSDAFVDIQGGSRPAPRLGTRVKMLWDDTAFYVAAELEEPHLWATLTARDSVIFHDNDFEIFIDPDGDTHAYYELEVNALGTAWDLLLVRPYRDGGPAVNAWDIAGLRVGVGLRGTLNRSDDRDQGWTVEIAMPWRTLREAAAGQRPPRTGDQWRVNFSRVQWTLDIKDAGYAKRIDAATGNALAEDNWVWSPQGAIDMHMPERWGFVQFSSTVAGAGVDAFAADPNEDVKWALRRLYYEQRRFRAAHGRFATDLGALGASGIRVEGLTFRPILDATANLYEIRAPGFNGATVQLRDDGRVWISRPSRVLPPARPPRRTPPR
jgi:hypothetical protein